nr:12434_t:CDS:2 [Entrophospora candida]
MNIYEATSLDYLAKVKEILAPKGSGGKVTDSARANFVESTSAIVDLEDQIGELSIISCKEMYLYHKKDNDGWTSLHNASAQGHLCIVKYLVESADSVDVDVGNNRNIAPSNTAYDAAATSNETYICEELRTNAWTNFQSTI